MADIIFIVSCSIDGALYSVLFFIASSPRYIRLAETLSPRLGYSRVGYKSAEPYPLRPLHAAHDNRHCYNVNRCIPLCCKSSLGWVSRNCCFNPHPRHCKYHLLWRHGAGYDTVDNKAEPRGIRSFQDGVLANVSTRWPTRSPSRLSPSSQPCFSPCPPSQAAST